MSSACQVSCGIMIQTSHKAVNCVSNVRTFRVKQLKKVRLPTAIASTSPVEFINNRESR